MRSARSIARIHKSNSLTQFVCVFVCARYAWAWFDEIDEIFSQACTQRRQCVCVCRGGVLECEITIHSRNSFRVSQPSRIRFIYHSACQPLAAAGSDDADCSLLVSAAV